jgi:hypothetical protein
VEPKLCSRCPYISFISLVKERQVCYTSGKEELTPIKLCGKLQAFAQEHKWKFPTCPYFPELETMERYVHAKAK